MFCAFLVVDGVFVVFSPFWGRTNTRCGCSQKDSWLQAAQLRRRFRLMIRNGTEQTVCFSVALKNHATATFLDRNIGTILNPYSQIANLFAFVLMISKTKITCSSSNHGLCCNKKIQPCSRCVLPSGLSKWCCCCDVSKQGAKTTHLSGYQATCILSEVCHSLPGCIP